MGRFSKVFLFYINGTYYILHGDARKSTSGNLSGLGDGFLNKSLLLAMYGPNIVSLCNIVDRQAILSPFAILST